MGFPNATCTATAWFGADALEQKLCDELSTTDDVLLGMLAGGFEIYSVKFRPPQQSPVALLGGGGGGDDDALYGGGGGGNGGEVHVYSSVFQFTHSLKAPGFNP